METILSHDSSLKLSWFSWLIELINFGEEEKFSIILRKEIRGCAIGQECYFHGEYFHFSDPDYQSEDARLAGNVWLFLVYRFVD